MESFRKKRPALIVNIVITLMIAVLITPLFSGCAVKHAIVQKRLGPDKVVGRQFRMHPETQSASRSFLYTDGKTWQAKLDPLPICDLYEFVRAPYLHINKKTLHWFDQALMYASYGFAGVSTVLITTGMIKGSDPIKGLGLAAVYVAPTVGIGVLETMRSKDTEGERWIREFYHRNQLVWCPDDALGFPVEIDFGAGQTVELEAYGEWFGFDAPVTEGYAPGTYNGHLQLNVDTQSLSISVTTAEFYPAQLDFDGINKEVDTGLIDLEAQLASQVKECHDVAKGSAYGAVPNEFFEQPTEEYIIPSSFRFSLLRVEGMVLKERVQQIYLLNEELLGQKEAKLVGKKLILPTVHKTLDEWRESLDEKCK